MQSEKFVFGRDQWITLATLIVLIVSAWWYTLSLSGNMTSDTMDAIPPIFVSWVMETWVSTIVMWVVMMVAMMTPSAIPMVLTYTHLLTRTKAPYPTRRLSICFAIGYFFVWSGFSLLATVLQWVFARAAMLSPEMMTAGPTATGTLLIIAGLYQLTPIKDTCLDGCRHPAQFLSEHWRTTVSGATFMGIEHGTYCVGCCWALMLLLFVGGIMNPLVIAGLAGFILLERIAPGRHIVALLSGGGLIASGLFILLSPLA